MPETDLYEARIVKFKAEIRNHYPYSPDRCSCGWIGGYSRGNEYGWEDHLAALLVVHKVWEL